MTTDFLKRYAAKGFIDAGEPFGDGIRGEFAFWVRAKLGGKDLSVQAAARKAGVPPTRVMNWERGVSMPRSEAEFLPVGRVLGCRLVDFFQEFVRRLVTTAKTTAGTSRAVRAVPTQTDEQATHEAGRPLEARVNGHTSSAPDGRRAVVSSVLT